MSIHEDNETNSEYSMYSGNGSDNESDNESDSGWDGGKIKFGIPNKEFMDIIESVNEIFPGSILEFDLIDLLGYIDISVEMEDEMRQALGIPNEVVRIRFMFDKGLKDIPNCNVLNGGEIQYQLNQAVLWVLQKHKNDARNILITLISTITDRIQYCGNYCPMCHQKHNYPGLKPVVCNNPLCYMQYTELGMGPNPETEIHNHPDICDLLINFTYIAANSHRAQDIMTPFPYRFIENGKKNIESVKKALDAFPSVEEMCEFKDLRNELDLLHPDAYYLLRWILSTNRCHLKAVENEDEYIKKQAGDLHFKKVFHIMHLPPEQQSAFQKRKANDGVVSLWHGSSSENWHNILRNSLKNYSGTKCQCNGNAYGSGVYLSFGHYTANGYSRCSSSARWSKSTMCGTDTRCLLLCNVIKDDKTKHGDIYVIPDEECIAMTHLFLC